MKPLLSVTNLRAGYGESAVLHDVALEIGEGEVVCLLGANGAGKTTTTRAICGLLKPWGGHIMFDGECIDAMPTSRRVELGICLSPEGRQVFPDLTVQENLLLGSYSPRARAHRDQTLKEVYTLFPRLRERVRQKAGLMSGGEQQMLVIGRALMGRPRLLMLDEPSLGLAPKMVADVYAAVATTAKVGISILIVEQNAEAALAASDRGYVLANGHIAAAGSAAELRGSALVREAFLGKPASDEGYHRAPTQGQAQAQAQAQGPAQGHAPGQPETSPQGQAHARRTLLEVRHMRKTFGGLTAIDDVSFDVQAGQCFGIIGANGAGKTTLLNLITGYLKPSAGKTCLEGDAVTGLAPHELAARGVGRTFQVVQPFAEMTVLENLMTGALFSAAGNRRSLAQAREFCEGPLSLVGLSAYADTLAGALTLGSKKKLELARVLATEPKIMLLDEVMGGLTRSEIEDIVEVLQDIKRAGTTIVMVEHLVHVVRRLCDHVFVLNFGRELFQGSPEDVVAHPEVIQAYLGKPIEAAT